MLDDAIRSAVAVARHGSFTAAAAHIGLTQSAITKRVAELEQRLGYAIFSRTARGVILTEKGVAFLDRATRLLEDLDLLMLRNQDPFVGPLRVGVCPAALDWVTVKPIAELARRYPQVRLDVSALGADRVTNLLRNGRVDVVMGLERLFAEQSDFSTIPLSALEARYFARKGHPLEHMECVPDSALANFDCLLPAEIPLYSLAIREIFENAGIPPATRLHAVDNFLLVRKLVIQSDAIGVVFANYTKSSAFSAKFTVINAAIPPTPGDLCCAVRARWELSPLLRAFIRACKNAWPAGGEADAVSDTR